MNEPSVGAQVVIAVIPIVGIVMGAVVIFFYLLWHHRQVMLQIRTGCYNPPKFDVKIFSLLVGILLTLLGIGLSTLLIIVHGISIELLGGIIPLTLGIGFVVFYSVVYKMSLADRK